MATVADMNIVITANVNGATTALNTVSAELTNTLAAQKVDSSLATTATTATKTESAFKSLSGSTSVFGGAIGSLVGSLVGTSGLLIAVGLVKSIIDEYAKKAAEAKKRTDEFNDAISKSAATINTETTRLSALVQVARNYSETQEARQNAIDQLQKTYPGYLANLNLENVNSQETAFAIEKLTDALARKAQVQAYSNLLTKTQEDLFKTQNADIRDNIGIVDRILGALKGGLNPALTAQKTFEQGIQNQSDTIDELQKNVDTYSHALSDLVQQQARSDDFHLLNPTKLKADSDNLSKALKKVKDDFEIIRLNQLAVIDNNNEIFAVPQAKATPFNFGNLGQPKPITELITNMQKVAEITQQVGQAFDSVFSSIANGANVFDAIGQALKQLITKLIATVVEAAILSVILNALGLGVGGTASFSAIFSMLSGIPKFASGGIVTKPTLAMIGDAGPEEVVPLNNFSGTGGNEELITEISGQNLRIILQRADRSAGVSQ